MIQSEIYGITETINILSSSKKSLQTITDNVSYNEVFRSSQMEQYKKHLSEKFGVRVTVESIGKDQHSLDKVGARMGGNDVIIAPNILQEMVDDSSKANYYEKKIQDFFDATPRLKKHFAAIGLTYEPCGVVIHEDGSVTYICGGGDSPERVAEVRKINELKQKKKWDRIDYINGLVEEKFNLHLMQSRQANYLEVMAGQQSKTPIVVTNKKYMPDGSIITTTREDGKIVEEIRKKPHMISVRDPLTNKVKMEPFISVFEDLM